MQKLVAEKQAAAVAAVAVGDGHYFPSEPWCVLEDANICSCLCDTDPNNKVCIQHFSSLIRKYCEKERIIRISLQDLMATTNSTYITFDMPSLKNKVKIQYYLTHSLMQKKADKTSKHSSLMYYQIHASLSSYSGHKIPQFDLCNESVIIIIASIIKLNTNPIISIIYHQNYCKWFFSLIKMLENEDFKTSSIIESQNISETHFCVQKRTVTLDP